MNIEFNGKFLYDSETGERICSIEDLKDREKAVFIIRELIDERRNFEDALDTAIDRIEELEDDLKMYEDNYGLGFGVDY
ncbi:hypothetical protein ST39-O_gp34 [Clostridium phage phiCP39-O]|uniref:hypothetical protein n=1 Tax=Clostridium phage phiCP39-O TaxID=541865 RepID=UPI000181BD02|nr:hypothetical protein ST39-O_gp34 [Clostridium phage phiCP39-O]ACE82016.1 hypothetical protein [Clostridium phage phiCP39-O]